MCDKCHKEMEPAEYVDGQGEKWIRNEDGTYSFPGDPLVFSSYKELREWDLAETYDCR
jgi:hypothetical protein